MFHCSVIKVLACTRSSDSWNSLPQLLFPVKILFCLLRKYPCAVHRLYYHSPSCMSTRHCGEFVIIVERRWRDLNSRAALTTYSLSRGAPSASLGTSPKHDRFLNHISLSDPKIRQRRGWDSNPRALADKRFSRPPRYDHFDTSPSICALTARKLYYHSKFQSVNKEKRFSPFLLFFRARQSHVLKQGSSYAVSYLSSDAL